MGDTPTQDLSSIFSVLPDGRPDELSSEVLEHYMSRGVSLSGVVRWAEFDRHGQFLGGGRTSMNDLSTQLFSDPSKDDDIQDLAGGAAAALARPGRIIAATGGTRCHWFVPIIPQGSSRMSEHRIKGLSISEELLSELVAWFNPAAGVTRAESRLLFQLLRGLTVRAAADEDSVSFETKRAQIKSVCTRLDCRGQNDLIRVIMGQLPHLLSIAETIGHDDGAIERFARDHLGPDVRLVLHRLQTGRILRTFECGPADGTPLLVAHGMMYPLLLLNCAGPCEELGVRLIMPVRNGYLDDQPTTALYAVRDPDDDISDVASFIRHNLCVPVGFASHSLGAAWAMAFAGRHPELVTQLLLLSPHFATAAPEKSRFFGPFLRGLASLANRPGLYRYVAWQFRRYFADAITVRRVLRRLFDTCADDLRVLEGQIGAGPAYKWFASAYRSSIVGIAEDMAAGMRLDATLGHAFQVPVTIVRGPDDPVGEDAPDEVKEIAVTLRCETLPAGGHFIAASHPEQMWNVVGQILTRPARLEPELEAMAGNSE